MITSFVFKKLSFIKQLLYYCINDRLRKKHGPYFIFFPPGYTKKEIHITYDVTEEWATKVKAMRQHKSQAKDIRRILGYYKDLPKKEYFLTLVK